MMIYLAAPVRAVGDETITSNLDRARRWYRHILRSYPNVSPIAPWVLTCEVLDDTIAEDRARGMALNEAVIVRCEAVWLFGPRISGGMAAEAALAKRYGIPVFDFTALGAEPPAEPGKLAGVAWEP